jgi:hypothetical protein
MQLKESSCFFLSQVVNILKFKMSCREDAFQESLDSYKETEYN